MAFILVIAIGIAVVWILALVDCLTSEFPHESDKLVWALVLIFLGILGAILYFLISPERKTRRKRRSSALRSRRRRRTNPARPTHKGEETPYPEGESPGPGS